MIEKKYQRRMILDKKDRDGLKSLLKEIEARREAATEKTPTPGWTGKKETHKMIDTENLTDEECGQILDELRRESPINAALQDLGKFVLYTLENEGKITPDNAVHLAKAAETAISLLTDELRGMQSQLEDTLPFGNT